MHYGLSHGATNGTCSHDLHIGHLIQLLAAVVYEVLYQLTVKHVLYLDTFVHEVNLVNELFAVDHEHLPHDIITVHKEEHVLLGDEQEVAHTVTLLADQCLLPLHKT